MDSFVQGLSIACQSGLLGAIPVNKLLVRAACESQSTESPVVKLSGDQNAFPAKKWKTNQKETLLL
jgi:hypothetical protein